MNTIIDPRAIESYEAPAFVPGSIKGAMGLLDATKRDYYHMDRASITVTKDYNVRMPTARRAAHVRWLADQMKQVGYDKSYPVLILITVEPDGSTLARITDGHCRIEAYDLAVSEGAELGKISVLVSKEQQDRPVDEIMATLVTANGGLQLEECEIAIVVQRQIRFGWTPEKVATRFCISKAQVKNYITVMRMHPSVRDAWFAGQVSMNVILALSKTNPHNVDTEVRRLVDEAKARAEASAAASPDADGKDQLDAFPDEEAHEAAQAPSPAAPVVPKVKLSQLPGRRYGNAVKYVAPRMHTVLSRITEHKDVLSMLPEELRNEIEELIAEVTKKAAGDKPAGASDKADASAGEDSTSPNATANASTDGKVVALQRVA